MTSHERRYGSTYSTETGFMVSRSQRAIGGASVGVALPDDLDAHRHAFDR
jgi:hypothetical protein